MTTPNFGLCHVVVPFFPSMRPSPEPEFAARGRHFDLYAYRPSSMHVALSSLPYSAGRWLHRAIFVWRAQCMYACFNARARYDAPGLWRACYSFVLYIACLVYGALDIYGGLIVDWALVWHTRFIGALNAGCAKFLLGLISVAVDLWCAWFIARLTYVAALYELRSGIGAVV